MSDQANGTELTDLERELAVADAANASKTAKDGSGILDKAGAAVHQAGEAVHTVTDAAAITADAAKQGFSAGRTAFDATSKAAEKTWKALDPAAHAVVQVSKWGWPKAEAAARWSWDKMAFRHDADGKRHFDLKHLGWNAVKLAICAVIVPPLLGAGYYYGTWSTYKDVEVPSTGVFLNEQFVNPNGAGQVIAPRDEIFTVLGKTTEPNGTKEPIRFDLDSNAYFLFYADSWRPDLASAKMLSSQGEKCTVEATGLYTRLSRYIRIWAVKWLDLRPEIVRVVECTPLNGPVEAVPRKEGMLAPNPWAGSGFYEPTKPKLGTASIVVSPKALELKAG